jgi:hypothetical protein
LAEEQYHDLSTDTKRVEYYNKRVEELKKENPDVADAPKAAFDMARQYAQHSVFPPFGFIAFPEDPKNLLGDEKGIEIAADRVLFGAARFINDLKKESPENLIQKGIDTYKGFDDSTAVNELTGATRMSFATVKGGLQEIQAAIRAEDKSADDPFEDSPILSKLKPDDIENLLDSTVLKFIKEIGLKRVDETNDKPILDKGEASFVKAKELAAKTNPITPKKISESKLNTKDDPEYMARLEKARKEDEMMDALTTGRNGAKIAGSKRVEAKPEGIKATETPVTTPPATPAASTQEASKNELVALSSNVTNNVTNNSTSVLQDQDAKSAPILKSETPAVTPEAKSAAAPAAIKQEATPTSANPPIEAKSTPVALREKSLVSDEETPLLQMLGDSIGMKPDDIAKMFAGKEENLQKGLDLTFGGESQQEASQGVSQATSAGTQQMSAVNPIPAAISQAQKATAQATTISSATKISEPVKMTEPAPAPTKQESPAPPPAPVPTTTITESASEETSAEKTKETPASETKPAEDTTSKDAGPSNDDLLKVMREILKTLQGPLIVTESTPKFS